MSAGTAATGGLFFVLEGIDGSGTTTQCARLRPWLEGRGREVHTTAEPSPGPIGRDIRRLLKAGPDAPDGDPGGSGGRGPAGRVGEAALALLFAADRLDHLEREVEPALARGAIVLCDRYVLSSLAYQALTAPLEWVEAINGRARSPDATLFLRVSPATAAERRRGRGGVVERYDADDTQQRVAANYERALSSSLAGRVHVIDAEAGLDAVEAALRRELEPLLRRAAAAAAP